MWPPLHSSAFPKPPVISHRPSNAEGGMGMKRSRWTLAGVQGGKGRQFVGQCWWETRRSEGLARSSSPVSNYWWNSCISLCLPFSSHPPWNHARKGLPKDTGRQKQDKDFQDRWRGKERLWNIKHDEVSLEWSGMFFFWIFLGLLKCTSGRINAMLYVSIISRMENLQQTFYNNSLWIF